MCKAYNKNIKSFAALSGMLRSFLATHPLCWRYVLDLPTKSGHLIPN